MLRKLFLAAFAGLAASLSAAPAAAVAIGPLPVPVPVESTFVFTGDCTDCVPGAVAPVTGTLVLSDYALGQAITTDNFVSWTYGPTGPIPTGYTITRDEVLASEGRSVGGVIDAPLPGPQDFRIFGAQYYFTTDRSGVFDTGRRFLDQSVTYDQGVNGSFAGAALVADVPEPATWGLMLAGFGLVGAAARRRTARVAFA